VESAPHRWCVVNVSRGLEHGSEAGRSGMAPFPNGSETLGTERFHEPPSLPQVVVVVVVVVFDCGDSVKGAILSAALLSVSRTRTMNHDDTDPEPGRSLSGRITLALFRLVREQCGSGAAKAAATTAMSHPSRAHNRTTVGRPHPDQEIKQLWCTIYNVCVRFILQLRDDALRLLSPS
jgi:hypothetical protein